MPASHFVTRQAQRLRLDPMYTAVTARRDRANAALHGHIYDISVAGVRIELDEPLSPGELVELHLDLPGVSDSLDVAASVVWIHDEQDDPGPRRMALRFTDFSGDDRDRLEQYLGGARRAA